MVKWNPLGTRVQERVTRSMARAEVEEVARANDPGARVSEVVIRIEEADQVAQQLGRALARRLGGNGTVGGHRFEVIVTYQLMPDWYSIAIRDRKFGQPALPVSTFTVTEEVLATHTRTVPLFDSWTGAVVGRLKELWGIGRPVTSDATGGWLETKLQSQLPSESDRERLIRELIGLGFVPRLDESTPIDATEEQAAIESIKEAMGRE